MNEKEIIIENAKTILAQYSLTTKRIYQEILIPEGITNAKWKPINKKYESRLNELNLIYEDLENLIKSLEGFK